MGDFLEQLSKYSTSQKMAGALVVYLIVSAVIWFGFVKPTKDQVLVAQNRNMKLVEERNENREIAENRERARSSPRITRTACRSGRGRCIFRRPSERTQSTGLTAKTSRSACSQTS